MGPLWKEPPSASSLAPAVNPARVRSMGRLGSQPGPALASLSLRFLICTMASRGGGGGAVLVSRCCAAPARAGGAAAAAAGAGVGCQESPHRQLLPPGAARGLQPSAGTRQAQVSGGWGAGGAATPWLGGGAARRTAGVCFAPRMRHWLPSSWPQLSTAHGRAPTSRACCVSWRQCRVSSGPRDLAGRGGGGPPKPNQQEQEGAGAGQLDSLTHSPETQLLSACVRREPAGASRRAPQEES